MSSSLVSSWDTLSSCQVQTPRFFKDKLISKRLNIIKMSPACRGLKFVDHYQIALLPRFLSLFTRNDYLWLSFLFLFCSSVDAMAIIFSLALLRIFINHFIDTHFTWFFPQHHFLKSLQFSILFKSNCHEKSWKQRLWCSSYQLLLRYTTNNNTENNK